MNSQSRSRKPNRKTCRTISAVTTPSTSPARSRAVLPVDQHRVADADHVAVGERLPADPAAVDQGAVGRAEVLRGGDATLEDDVDVLAAHSGVREPDVGVGAAADHVPPGGELVPGAGPVDDEDVRGRRAAAGPADDRGTLPAGVGGHPPAQRREGRQRRVPGGGGPGGGASGGGGATPVAPWGGPTAAGPAPRPSCRGWDGSATCEPTSKTPVGSSSSS